MKYVQQVGANEATEDARIAPPRVITVDTDGQNLRLHDGVTPGGHKIPNENSIAGYTVRLFLSVVPESVPGALAAVDIAARYLEFSVAGHYIMPDLADMPDIGGAVRVCATVAGVILDANSGAQKFNDNGVDSGSLNLVQNEIVTLAKKTGTRWLVMDRY